MASTSHCVSARSRLAAALLALACATAAAAAADARAPEERCADAQASLHLVVTDMQAALERAADPQARARAAARLGEAYLRMNRLAEAEPLLQQAADAALPPREKASALLDLGNLQLARRRPEAAEQAWAAAAAAAPQDAEIALAAELNRTRLAEPEARLARLGQALPRTSTLADASLRARHALNVAAQALELPQGVDLARRGFEAGRDHALAARDDRLSAQAWEGLATLLDDAQRSDDALVAVEQAIAYARRVRAHDLLMNLEARAGRLARRLGRADLALDAMRRAVEHIEAVRTDIPVQYLDGRSSFRLTLEPTYLALTDLLLQRATQLAGGERQAVLRQARDTVELIKQTELEDYLRDRCSVGSARGGSAPALPAGTAIYYPIILPDRLELLVETARGIESRQVAIDGERLRDEVLSFVGALRAGTPLRARAQALYRLLIEPIEPLLAAGAVDTLVAVPDGVLRLLPLASLHDGRRWLIERMAMATAPALSLTTRSAPAGGSMQALMAGMSEPGPVLDKLPDEIIGSVLDPGADTRKPAARDRPAGVSTRDAASTRALKEQLALPGVRQEIEGISRVMPGTVLLDERFTLAALKEQLASRTHPVVHIASHGVFGDSAETTFIMTYDDLLTIDGLQALLRGDRNRRTPIDLLTLSACQTAEGDDRAPLGMSGTALKARARSALGTLWPVADDAANRVMSNFYQRLARGGESRAQSLRNAQLELLARPGRQHPFFWAPFVLIGDWQ